jgi:hypothetical protein
LNAAQAWPARCLIVSRPSLRRLRRPMTLAANGPRGKRHSPSRIEHENSKRLAYGGSDRRNGSLDPGASVRSRFRHRASRVHATHGQVDGSQAMNLAVHYSCIAGTSGETETHAFNLDLPEAWQCWSDFQQGRWVLDQVLIHIDTTSRDGRPAWLEFGYELNEGVSLPC